jgi:hypothetical protein
MKWPIAYTLFLIVVSYSTAAATTRKVGPGQRFTRPCQAIAAASDGDLILIDAGGNYDGDVCVIAKNGLTLRGINGRPRLNAAGKSAQEKGTWVIAGSSTTVDNLEFTGSQVHDKNGAGIRQEGRGLTVRNCYFHNNEMGILTGASGDVLIEYSEFAYNGHGDGQSHNLYVNHATSFIMRFCYSHHSIGGQLVKSRAATTHILFNRLTDESGSNYEIDLPNGGLSYVIGNVIQKSATSTNPSALLTYLVEGASPLNPDNRLFVMNNTFVNAGIADCRFIWIYLAGVTALIQNNIFTGPGTVTTKKEAVVASNFRGDPQFMDGRSLDYHLEAGSPALAAGRTPNPEAGTALLPQFQYVHPACAEQRDISAGIDLGAYQSGNQASVTAAPPRCSH